MKRTKKCPLCGAKVVFDDLFLSFNAKTGKWAFHHFCGDGELVSCISVYGKTKEEVIDRWNKRFS